VLARAVTAAALTLLMVAGSALSQEATGRIEGRVLTVEGRPLASVRVTASGPDLQQSRLVESDAAGHFRLAELAVGVYRLHLAFVGYRPVVLEGVTVRLGCTTVVGAIRVNVRPAELGEIVVRAAPPLIDPTSPASRTNLTADQLAELPTDRNFRSILTIAPQADQSFLPHDEANVAGGTGPENAYYLDGVNISDPQLGSGSANLPYNFVREIQVKTGGYEAEFGRATGGIVDVITHSGGDRVGGQIFTFFTGDGLTAEPRLPPAGSKERAFSEYDVGGSLGGPILRERLWYFLAYNPSFRRDRVEVAGPPLPSERVTQHLFATKLTWRADSRTDVVLTAHGDPARLTTTDLSLALDSILNPESVVANERRGGLVLSLASRRHLSGRSQVEFGVSRFTQTMRSEAPSTYGSTEPLFRDLATGVVSGGLGLERREDAARTGIRLTFTTGLGLHTPKVGVEYEDNHLDLTRDFSAAPGSPGGTIFRLDDASFLWQRGLVRGSLHNRVLSGYLQDSWRLSERFMIVMGLRWDGQFLTGPDGRVAQRFTNQWQPRVGFTLGLGPPGADKLFGSYGRFYEQIPLTLSSFYYSATGNVLLAYDHDPRSNPSGADTLFDLTAELEPPHDLRGQGLDEFTLGYERQLGPALGGGIRAVYRHLRWAIEDAINPSTGEYELGNPGRGNLAFTPRARRTYMAVVVSLDGTLSRRIGFRASYVLSHLSGNYEGEYDYWSRNPFPNVTAQFDTPDQYSNSTGALPNDRPSVLKLSGAWRFLPRSTIGVAAAWMSGTPRNEFGGTVGGPSLAFLRPRGSAGRTESVLDLNLRLTYSPRPFRRGGIRPRIYLDLFHLANRRSAVAYDDVHYFSVEDGRQVNPNPAYESALAFQPPTSARLGLSLAFGAEP